MNTRQFLSLLLGAVLVTGSVHAQQAAVPKASTPAAVDVVKIMSFSCSFCLQAESFDAAIETAARATGGRFVRAPIPTVEGDQGASEQLYYASRSMSPEFAERVKSSMYKAFQSSEVQLLDFMQVYTWITQDLQADEPKFNELFKKAQDKEAKNALVRAVRLSMNNGVQYTPTYLLLVSNNVKAVLDTSSAGAAGMAGLRNTVINQIELISKQNATTPTP